MRIQHNIMAMNAYRNYNTNTKALSGNLEKLSSGYKINRAGDDAAGLAISEKMRAQITGLDAAQKNVKDGVSLVKTAEGAMQEIQDMLNRMDYLATQSANGTYDNEVDRKNLQKEVDALKTEIDRIADSANFNGIKLLDGSLDKNVAASTKEVAKENLKISSLDCGQGMLHKEGVTATGASFDVSVKEAFSVANATQTIGKNTVINVKVTVGSTSITVKATVTGTIAKGAAIDLSKIQFTAASQTVAIKTANGSYSMKMSLASTGIMSFSKASKQTEIDFDAAMKVTITASKATFSTDGDNKTSYDCNTQNVKNGYAAKGTQLAHAHLNVTQDMVDALVEGGTLKIDTASIKFDAKAVGVTGSTVGIKDLLNDEGKIDVNDTKKMKELMARLSQAANGNAAFHVGVEGNTLTLQEKAGYYTENSPDENLLDTKEKIEAKIELQSSVAGRKDGKGLELQIGDTSDPFNQMTVGIGDMHVDAMGTQNKNGTVTSSIKDISIAKQSDAQAAVQVIRDAINYVSGVRGDLGAIQNRLEHTGNNLSVMAENIQDAESTIRDTDVADEMMKYVKNNILVQSAQAMLAQANQVPQGVLQLLG